MTKASVKENRKEAVYAAAVACFIENGYYGTSMDMIAERADMTKRGLYYHFKSKDELFINLFHYMNARYYKQIPEYLLHINDPEEKLLMFVNVAKNVLAQGSDFLRFSQEFLSISVRKPEIRLAMLSYYNEQVEKVQKIIQDGVACGKFIPIDTLKMARAFVLLTMGAFNVYFSLDPGFDLAEQHSFDIEHLVACLHNKESSAGG